MELGEEEDMNRMSVVGLLSWNDFEVLLTGDIWARKKN